ASQSTSFGTRGSQVQILPLRPSLSRNSSRCANGSAKASRDERRTKQQRPTYVAYLSVTWLSNQLPDAAGKLLEFLREIVPDFRRLAILTNIANPIGAVGDSAASGCCPSAGH